MSLPHTLKIVLAFMLWMSISKFPNSLKRPDIVIFCREPTEEEQDRTLTLIPEAVIEVISKGYEAKDLQIGPPFYLSQGVKDVIVFDHLPC